MKDFHTSQFKLGMFDIYTPTWGEELKCLPFTWIDDYLHKPFPYLFVCFNHYMHYCYWLFQFPKSLFQQHSTPCLHCLILLSFSLCDYILCYFPCLIDFSMLSNFYGFFTTCGLRLHSRLMFSTKWNNSFFSNYLWLIQWLLLHFGKTTISSSDIHLHLWRIVFVDFYFRVFCNCTR